MKKHVEVFMGQYPGGTWFASSSDIPWLAAEGDSPDEVMLEINHLAIALSKRSEAVIDFPLTWLRVAEEF